MDVAQASEGAVSGVPSARQPRRGPQIIRAPQTEIEFDYRDRFEPGEYPAYCRATKVWRDKQYRRWICTLQFDVRTEDLLQVIGRVTMFLNLGKKERPHAGRRGKYWAAWLQANGGHPKRRDKLSQKVFERRMALIVIGDVPNKFYSVVREIEGWETL